MVTKLMDLPHYSSAQDFNARAKKIFEATDAADKAFALVSIDCDNFNFVNDLFSFEIGDAVLQGIMKHFSKFLTDTECFTRLHADHFVFFVDMKHEPNMVERFCKMAEVKDALADILPPHYSLVFSGGIVPISEYGESYTVWLDKAIFARKQAKGNHANTMLIYDKKMGEELQWKKTITLMMESALRDQEFEMYLQPKVLIKTGQIVGAEALVRWNSKEHGLIYPGRFIPILEQNGFIKQLDFFMLEQACLFLKKQREAGKEMLPISINFSKMHLRSAGFVEKVFYTVNRHAISTNLIEIEVTENIYLGDFEALIEVASALKCLGFKVSLDDFGSAYSSLNYLKDLPLDVVKIDKGFLNATENTDRGNVIIAKMIELIKSLRLIPIMEGVETEEQVDFLQKLGCDLGQGYYYAKPMPASEYTKFVKGSTTLDNIEQYLLGQQNSNDRSYTQIIPQEFQMDNWELYTLGKNIDMGLMKGYLDGDATVQYVNDKALEYLGYTRQEFREIFKNSIVEFTHPDDAHLVHQNTKRLIENGRPLQFQARALRKDGKVIVLQGRSSCVLDSQGRPIGIYAFQDVTEELERTAMLEASVQAKIRELEQTVESERKARAELRLSEERYRMIVEQSDDIMFDWNFETDTIEFSKKYIELFGNAPIQENVSSNTAILERIHPDDRECFTEWVRATHACEGLCQAEYRIKSEKGEYISMRNRSTTLRDENGRAIKAVGVFAAIGRAY